MNDLNLLKVFEIVIRTGSVHKSAEMLNITPSAVSQSLNRLRDKYPDPLFVRDGRNLKPTNFSLALYDHIKEHLNVLLSTQDFFADFDPLTSTRTFKISTHSDLELLFYSDLLNLLDEKAPNIKLKLINNFENEDALQNSLRLRNADLSITVQTMKEMSYNTEILSSENVMVIARKGHPKVIDNEISFDDFFNARHAASSFNDRETKTLESIAKQNLPARNIEYVGESVLNIVFTVSNTDLIGLMPQAFYEHLKSLNRVNAIKPPFEMENIDIYMNCHKSMDEDAGIIWLKEQIRNLLKK